MSGLRFSKLVVAICGGVPLALLSWDAFRGRLGADPVNFAIRTTGLLALIFLLLSLTVTPARRLTGWDTLVGYRRSLGLYGFAYACVHLGIYVVWDRALNLASAVQEIVSRRYLQVGFAAVVLMLPLAITSTDGMIRRLSPRRWKRLHRLAYVAACLAAVHYYMQVKSDVTQPLVFGGVLAALLLFRAVWHYVELRRAAGGVGNPPKAVAGASGAARAAARAAAGRTFWTGDLRVARTFDETQDVRTFRLVALDGGDLPFDYRPGQYLTLRLSVDGRAVSRSYTIASSPTRQAYCELTVKREEMGASSGHLHRAVREGDCLTIAAPAGRFVFTGEGADGVVLIAGGVGITPLMSMLRYLTDRAWPGRIHLLVAARTERALIFRDEIEHLRRRFPNLHVCVTLSRAAPPDGSAGAWPGERGRIDADLLRRSVPALARLPVYLCGPDAMMAATRAALAGLGVPDASVHTEAFVAATTRVAEPVAMARAGSPDAPAVPSDDADGADPVAIPPGDRIVTFAKSNRAGPIAAQTTVLEAAEALGVELPFECRAGVCGQCKTRLVAGAVMMATEEALSPSEKAAGWILACQARAVGGDLVIGA